MVAALQVASTDGEVRMLRSADLEANEQLACSLRKLVGCAVVTGLQPKQYEAARQIWNMDASGHPDLIVQPTCILSPALVEVTVDHDAGTLGYSINGGPRFETLRGFPPAAALRLWAKLTSAHFTGPGEERSDDLISLVSAWV